MRFTVREYLLKYSFPFPYECFPSHCPCQNGNRMAESLSNSLGKHPAVQKSSLPHRIDVTVQHGRITMVAELVFPQARGDFRYHNFTLVLWPKNSMHLTNLGTRRKIRENPTTILCKRSLGNHPARLMKLLV